MEGLALFGLGIFIGLIAGFDFGQWRGKIRVRKIIPIAKKGLEATVLRTGDEESLKQFMDGIEIVAETELWSGYKEENIKPEMRVEK